MLLAGFLSLVADGSVAAYFIMNVEILGERVTSGRDGFIVGNVNGVVEVFRVYQ